MLLTDFKVLTFDCYGTLIDWESGMVEALSRSPRALPQLSRDDVLEAHARHESGSASFHACAAVSRAFSDRLQAIGGGVGRPGAWDECLAYGNSIRDWPAFEDSATALHYLKKHYRLVILSNVDNASFTFSNRRLQVEFDAIYTAEDIGSYKPRREISSTWSASSPREASRGPQILHTAESLFHDHAPANSVGLASCWIHRRHDKPGFGATVNPAKMPKVDFRFNSMAALAKQHAEELAR